MLERLAQLVHDAKPFDPAAFAWPSDAAERRAAARRGMVPKAALELVRVAHDAVFHLRPSEGWQALLRALVRYALRYKLAGSLPPLQQARSGKAIVERVRKSWPDAPGGLTAAKVDAVLQKGTLARRGGRGKRNVEGALDDMIAAVSQSRRRKTRESAPP